MARVDGASVLRHLAAILAPILFLLLAGCSDAPGKSGTSDPPNPLLYELASADGTVEGWMIGTIHALPPETHWQTPQIGRVIHAADFLVVEVAGLGEDRRITQAFASLSASPGLPPLRQRVPADLEGPLADLLARADLSAQNFASTETWAAAIALARVDAVGDPANGVDRALLQEFAGRPVRELEGGPAQLAIFDRLPEAQQRLMLAAVVRGSEAARKDPERLQRAWLAGDEAMIAASTREGFLADPELREALLVARNRRWTDAIAPMLAGSLRPLIAVGTAHLVGPDGLVAMLQERGYVVKRIR